MSLLRLPRSKFSLAFLAAPAGKNGRVECPCQTVDDFIGVRGSVCGLFLFVQTHAPLIVPPWQSQARKSKFQFLSGARARKFSALHLLSADSLMAYKCLSLCDFFIVQQFFKLCHICLMLFENLRGLHFHIGIIRHLGEILHQEINILLDSPDGSFQCRIVDSVDSFLRSRAVLRVQNLVHDLLAVRKIGSGKEVH